MAQSRAKLLGMNNPKNLDDYLAGLGISDADEMDSPPPPEVVSAAPTLEGGHEDPHAVLERFLRGLIARIDPQLQVEIRDVEGAFEVEITGESAARLAGRDGRTLQAIEVLAYTVLAKQASRNDLRIRVDIGGYRKRQAESLARLAERLAVQVAKSGEEHALQPMSAADRRIIHMTLKEHPDVMTESVGEGAGRHLIVKPRHV